MEKEHHIESWYRENIVKYREQCQKQQDKSNNLSAFRLAAFLLAVVLWGVGLYISSGWLLLGNTIAFIFIFGSLVNTHNRVKDRIKHLTLLAKINQDESDRLKLNLSGFPQGKEYMDSQHPYAVDLDLFGPHSLFQWLNRTVTRKGEQHLANSLKERASIHDIIKRQEAVAEIANIPDWGQQFVVSGLAFKGHQDDISPFVQWVSSVTPLPRWFKPALMTLPAMALSLTILYFLGSISGYWVLPILVLNGILLSKVQPFAQDTYNQTHKSVNTLKAYEAMIAAIERTDFKGELLTDLRSAFLEEQQNASTTIRQLKNILSRIEVRHNFLYWILNAYFLLDIIWLLQSESWKAAHGNYIDRWFDSLTAYELVVSLGLSAHSQQESVFPKFDEEPYLFDANSLGHPLIPLDERVSNDFTITNKGSVVVLTGSNMSGKSTFLRTIGVNTVLAGMGAPVCASSLKIGTFSLFTSMRTTDSLEQHVSSFYAELERIRKLIGQLEEQEPTLFLLDELLKGTNSNDRNQGSMALIKQLRQKSAFGIISTHDLALGSLEKEYDNISNFSFNSELIDGSLSFDYRLRDGLCSSFNATELMAQMGIDLESNLRT